MKKRIFAVLLMLFACSSFAQENYVQQTSSPYNAGYNTNLKGYYTVSMGRYSGMNITTGYRNVFLGNEAGKNTTTGGYNIGIGFQSLLDNNTSIQNIAIGTYSLRDLTGGSYSIGIGFLTGENVTWSHKDIFLGYKAGTGATGGHKLYIGNYDGETGYPMMIYGDMLNTKLAIGHTTPTATFSVQGNGTTPILDLKDNSGVEKFSVTESGNVYVVGNVGIGTNTPDRKLSIKGNTGIVISNDGNTNHLRFCHNPNPEIGSSTGNISLFYGSGYNNLTCGGIIINNGSAVKAEFTSDGKLWAQEVVVQLTDPFASWPDFVFGKKYELKSLYEVETYINENNHLPNVPSSEVIQENGINLGQMDAILLQKIEELTLYSIEQQKMIDELRKEIENLKK